MIFADFFLLGSSKKSFGKNSDSPAKYYANVFFLVQQRLPTAGYVSKRDLKKRRAFKLRRFWQRGVLAKRILMMIWSVKAEAAMQLELSAPGCTPMSQCSPHK
ncbi:hypothetical protein A1342_09355 [Methylomonas methanica]|uniref:Uncharacterized protein n=1 Tax=Methylomonas denitrificans TaxID=1538553 RepID=A0A140E5S9_9GAMM|nr:hypothetical protein JT25_020045 [Methylomonas denitrificans]OAH98989.1 hypothetical protein A1342_09355 [Methylomonas methanica]